MGYQDSDYAICQSCGGMGHSRKPCPTCGGAKLIQGRWCGTCNGSGQLQERCPACGGQGKVRRF